MKKIIILPLLFIGLLGWGQAQFIVQNGSKTEIYNNINTAIDNAVAGDTLYIPGGGFALGNTTISKSLHWVGHGHYPAATGATMQSRITSNLTFDGACDNSSFEGIWFTGTLTFGSTDDEALNITMKRCRVSGTFTLRKTDSETPNLNFFISECVINGNLNAKNGSNCHIEKSILFDNIGYFYQSLFVNLIHMPSEEGYYNCETIKFCNSSTFKNSIFAAYSGIESTNSCTFLNNIYSRTTFVGDTERPGTGNTDLNNIYGVPIENIFPPLTGDAWLFSYDNDYHLIDGSPGINHGDDNLDVGIYGSTSPYKENAIPYYPHINTANIAPNSVNNQLGVIINAEAQSR